MGFKEILSRVAPRQKLLGFKDFLQFNKFKSPWGFEFNGQELRRNMVLDVLSSTGVKQVIETGTYRGTTTSFFLQQACRVFTSEYSPRYYMYSKLRFLSKSKLSIYNEDSRVFLRRLAKQSRVTNELTIFYLDAHWDADLPLREELEIIDKHWPRYIILIDDYEVPGDSGYVFDDYGGESVLNAAYLDRTGINFKRFYPISSANETGVKSGSVVLTKDDATVEALRKNKYLFEKS